MKKPASLPAEGAVTMAKGHVRRAGYRNEARPGNRKASIPDGVGNVGPHDLKNGVQGGKRHPERPAGAIRHPPCVRREGGV